MLSGEEIWCQLFSEPGGGSDVAALRTSAARNERGWVINGQKVWTSGAHHSDFGAILARTDPTVPKHDGITMLIVDMRHPGVTVRPLRIATGEAPFNEVFFDDVEVPHDAVIGEVNGGWAAAVAMLRNERIMLGAGGSSRANPLGFEALRDAALEHGSGSSRLAELYARELGLTSFGRLLHEEALAGVPIGARGSVGKLAGAELMMWAADLAGEVLGEALLVQEGLAGVRYAAVYGPGHAVAGGSSEIQRNIIGERVLGLPKDGGVDKAVPFNQLRFGS
jgi:alkylation response protein AidB-like acyl-CoA dehydrogenase